MKKILLIMLSLGLVIGASAQKYRGGGGYRYVGPRVGLSMGAYAPFSPYYGYGYGFGYSPWGFPPAYGYSHAYRPSKLDLKIDDIKNDYKDKIWSVRHDKNLTGKQRRQEVRSLKHERDLTVEDARINYYKSKQSN